jgi:hypothetical protein
MFYSAGQLPQDRDHISKSGEFSRCGSCDMNIKQSVPVATRLLVRVTFAISSELPTWPAAS